MTRQSTWARRKQQELTEYRDCPYCDRHTFTIRGLALHIKVRHPDKLTEQTRVKGHET